MLYQCPLKIPQHQVSQPAISIFSSALAHLRGMNNSNCSAVITISQFISIYNFFSHESKIPKCYPNAYTASSVPPSGNAFTWSCSTHTQHIQPGIMRKCTWSPYQRACNKLQQGGQNFWKDKSMFGRDSRPHMWRTRHLVRGMTELRSLLDNFLLLCKF